MSAKNKRLLNVLNLKGQRSRSNLLWTLLASDIVTPLDQKGPLSMLSEYEFNRDRDYIADIVNTGRDGES